MKIVSTIRLVGVDRISLNISSLLILLICISCNSFAAGKSNTSPVLAATEIQAQWENSTFTPGLKSVDKNKIQSNRFIVKYRSGISKSIRDKIVLQYSLQTIKQYKSLPNIDVVLINSDDPDLLFEQIKKTRMLPT